jgi:hypothetical protein
MHAFALSQSRVSIETYLDPHRRWRVLDLGWGHQRSQVRAHRALFVGYDVDYRRVDVLNTPKRGAGPRRRYGIPAASGSADVVLSAHALTRVPFFWATALEIERVLVPGGFAFLCVASRGHPTADRDYWRFYADAYRALAAHTGMELLDAYHDHPRWDAERNQWDYGHVRASRYWGDCVGALRKPHRRPDRWRRAVVRRAAVWWANQADQPAAAGVQSAPGNGTPAGPSTV